MTQINRSVALVASLLLLAITGCQTPRESPQTAPAFAPSEPDRQYLYAGILEITEYPHPLTMLTNLGYVAGYDEIRGMPAWVAYRVFAVEHYLTHPRPPGSWLTRAPPIGSTTITIRVPATIADTWRRTSPLSAGMAKKHSGKHF